MINRKNLFVCLKNICCGLCISYSQIESFSLIFVVEDKVVSCKRKNPKEPFFSERNLRLLLWICKAPLTSNNWDIGQLWTLQLLTPNNHLPQLLVIDLFIFHLVVSLTQSRFPSCLWDCQLRMLKAQKFILNDGTEVSYGLLV
jgi:hypothetical protein